MTQAARRQFLRYLAASPLALAPTWPFTSQSGPAARSLEGALDGFVRKSAYTGGIDFSHAWSQRTWNLTGSEHPGSGVFSVVLERRPEGWRIIHDHTSSAP